MNLVQRTLFYGWLSRQTTRADDVGSLAKYVVKDRFFPKDAKRLHIFLLRYEHQPEQRRQVKIAHREWRLTQKHSERASVKSDECLA